MLDFFLFLTFYILRDGAKKGRITLLDNVLECKLQRRNATYGNWSNHFCTFTDKIRWKVSVPQRSQPLLRVLSKGNRKRVTGMLLFSDILLFVDR